MGIMFALGLGAILGALAAFPAGKHYGLAELERRAAAERWGYAREHYGRAAGPLALLFGVVVVGLLAMFFGR
jgi:hypothetical protein